MPGEDTSVTITDAELAAKAAPLVDKLIADQAASKLAAQEAGKFNRWTNEEPVCA